MPADIDKVFLRRRHELYTRDTAFNSRTRLHKSFYVFSVGAPRVFLRMTPPRWNSKLASIMCDSLVKRGSAAIVYFNIFNGPRAPDPG